MVIGAESPFDELRALRSYGKVVARGDPPSFFLRWSDDAQTVSHGDTFSITMSQFRGLADHFISSAEALTERLMLGLQPDVDLDSVVDDLANERPGFSFIRHPRNALHRRYLDLVHAAFTCHHDRLAVNGRWSWTAAASIPHVAKHRARENSSASATRTDRPPRAASTSGMATWSM
ncbi:hypothetical protein VUR80DRAFT_1151 [Thermomyces stellatus]